MDDPHVPVLRAFQRAEERVIAELVGEQVEGGAVSVKERVVYGQRLCQLGGALGRALDCVVAARLDNLPAEGDKRVANVDGARLQAPGSVGEVQEYRRRVVNDACQAFGVIIVHLGGGGGRKEQPAGAKKGELEGRGNP